MQPFKHKKSFGQNFINNQKIIDKIVKSINFNNNTLVIEIGPGEGILTKELLKNCSQAILYEIDERLEKVLKNNLKMYDNYELIINDFLNCNVKNDLRKYSFSQLEVIANLPYYITTPIILKLLEEIYPFRITIMVQKEVANRFSAKPGTKDYGAITVYLNAYYNITKLFDVDKNNFSPIPKVNSAVIQLTKKESYKEILNNDNFKKIVKDSFQYKRKNIKNNLEKYNLEKVEKVLKKYNLALTSRSEQIPLEAFIELSNKIR